MTARNRSAGGFPKFMLGNIVVFSVTGLLGNFARSMVFPYASLYIMALDGNAKTIGLVNFLRPLLGLILFPIAGYLADRKSRIKMKDGIKTVFQKKCHMKSCFGHVSRDEEGIKAVAEKNPMLKGFFDDQLTVINKRNKTIFRHK